MMTGTPFQNFSIVLMVYVGNVYLFALYLMIPYIEMVVTILYNFIPST